MISYLGVSVLERCWLNVTQDPASVAAGRPTGLMRCVVRFINHFSFRRRANFHLVGVNYVEVLLIACNCLQKPGYWFFSFPPGDSLLFFSSKVIQSHKREMVTIITACQHSTAMQSAVKALLVDTSVGPSACPSVTRWYCIKPWAC